MVFLSTENPFQWENVKNNNIKQSNYHKFLSKMPSHKILFHFFFLFRGEFAPRTKAKQKMKTKRTKIISTNECQSARHKKPKYRNVSLQISFCLRFASNGVCSICCKKPWTLMNISLLSQKATTSRIFSSLSLSEVSFVHTEYRMYII